MFKISVIIPVFNVKDYIDDAFKSLLNQSIGFENLEVIFVDDASDDGSSLIIDKYADKYNNVTSIHLDENSGAAGKPRNVAMEYATSDYLMFLDPDDVYMKNACEILYDEITTEKIDIVSGIHTTNGEDIHQILWKHILTDPYEDNKVRLEKVNETVKDSSFSLKFDSIDDCPTLITNFGMWTKIYKRQFLVENNIKFLEGIPAQDTVFLFNVLLNAKGIKFINKVITDHLIRESSISFEFTEKRVKERLDAYYEMFYISSIKNKVDIFKYYILFNKLNYFLRQHLMICNLTTNEVLNILEYAHPLFKLCVTGNSLINGKFAKLFRYIADKDYENALKFIQEDGTVIQNEIKIIAQLNSKEHDLFNDSCVLINLSEDNWLNQFNNECPDLFVYNYSENEFYLDNMGDIIKYCKDNNIITIFLKNNYSDEFLKNNLFEFDYFIEWDSNYSLNNSQFYEEIHYLDCKFNNLSSFGIKVKDDEFFNSMKNQQLFSQILNIIGFRYNPIFLHLVLCYDLHDLNELNDIYTHFNSIDYPYKHIKLITDENNLFLPDAISSLSDIKLKDNYYVARVNME